MEKHQLKLKSRILKILPKASSITVTFQNHPFSPGRWDKQHHHNHHGVKGFSGPIVSMIPDEARRKPKGERNNTHDQEPTSPKISCMGQIKNKKKKCKKVSKEAAKTTTTKSTSKDTELKKKNATNKFQRMLLSAGRKSSASAHDQNDDDNKDAVAVSDRVPHVSQMRKLASGRDTFANFDWKAHQQVAPDEEIEDFYSDEERVQQRSDEEEEDYDDDDVRIPFSAPILVGGNSVGVGVDGVGFKLKPRKEINLWKRRTMAPPRPLQLNLH
ncbi:hypothetical protein PIB30_058607 [Stylosanthes scabra]|uniref:Syringolide-induced protein 14-1-1 n=1 Tax=Stylosanthes scabra TaxID=79078 RepID=A0ABU6WK02_9FABA|nr:hypothetical protein [Stylosanthes scabra]